MAATTHDMVVSVHGEQLGLDKDGYSIGTRRGVSTTTITSTQLLALNATGIEVVPALGAGLAAVVTRWTVYKPAGTAYGGIASGEELQLKFTSNSGASVANAIETTGFLDSAAAITAAAGGLGSVGDTPTTLILLANTKIVCGLLSGEITTGNSPIYVRVWYDIVDTVYTA